jgi:GNAT superfamily N-acetyltransferase
MGSGFTPFRIAGRTILSLGREDLPMLQRLLERCGDYFDMAEGQPAGPNEAEEEFTAGPPERFPQDQFCLGIPDDRPGELAGVLGALRHHRRPNQWYLGLLLLDPNYRGSGLGRTAYEAFEQWIRRQGADSVVLAVLEVNTRAAGFWESLGFATPRCYPARQFGQRRHVLIEYEKDLTPLA